MKNYLYLLWILSKRLMRSPGFLFALLWLPISLLILYSVEKKSGAEAEAAVFASGDKFALDIEKSLLEYQGFIRFRACKDQEEVRKRVASGKAECGYILGPGIHQGMEAGDIQKLVTVYRPPNSRLAGVINEIVFAKILGTYSPEFYLSYVEAALGKEGEDEAVIRKKAQEYYQEYLNNGSTFRFQFYGGEEAVYEEADIHVIPVRGLMAVMIFLCGLCGLGDWKECKNNNRFFFTKHLWTVKTASLFLPMAFAAAVGLSCLYLTGNGKSVFLELEHMAAYLLLLEAFFLAADCFMRTGEAVYGIFPFAAMISLLLPPVFFDFSILYPPVKWIQLLLPVSWYLRLG